MQKKFLQSSHYTEPWGAAIVLEHPVGKNVGWAKESILQRIGLKLCEQVATQATTLLIFLQTDPMHCSVVTALIISKWLKFDTAVIYAFRPILLKPVSHEHCQYQIRKSQTWMPKTRTILASPRLFSICHCSKCVGTRSGENPSFQPLKNHISFLQRGMTLKIYHIMSRAQLYVLVNFGFAMSYGVLYTMSHLPCAVVLNW